MVLVTAKSSTDYVEIDPVLIYTTSATSYVIGSAVTASGRTETDVEIWENSSAPDLIWTIMDSDDNPVDLSASSLRLLVLDYEDDVVFYLETGGSGLTVGGDDNNEVAANYSTTNTATPGTFHYELWRLDGGASGDEVLAYGAFVILPTVKTAS